MPVRIGKEVQKPYRTKDAVQETASARRKALKAAAIAEDCGPLTAHNDLLPELQVTFERINDLKAPVRMIRALSPEAVEQVANSIRELKASDPILIGADNVIVDGVARWKAAQKIGLETFPCIRLSHLSPDQQELFRIAKHQIGANRPYIIPELKLALGNLVLKKQPIQLLGFASAELDTLLMPSAEELAHAEDDANADDEAIVKARPVSQEGDLWELGDHLLLCGDAKQVESYEQVMGGDRAQLVLTDPPYGVEVAKVVSTKHDDFIEGGAGTSQAEFEQIITSSFTHMRDYLVSGGMLLSYMDWKHVADLIAIGKSLGLEHLNLITWVKTNGGGMGSLWRSQSEFVVALKRPGKHKNNIQLGKWGRDRTNVWQVAGAGAKGTEVSKMLKHHPTPKPVPMLADAIADVTDAGDIVLDPFAGSGSTLIAAEQTKRRARLIERDPKYCDLIIRRWQDAGRYAVLASNGDRFCAVAEQRLVEARDDA